MFYLSVQCHYVIKHIGHKSKVNDHERKSVGRVLFYLFALRLSKR